MRAWVLLPIEFMVTRPIDQLAVWIDECSSDSARYFNIRTVHVVIGQETWPGVWYEEELQYQPGMDCVTRGQKKAGDKYYEECIYCVGDLPKPYRGPKRNKYPKGNVCFPFQGREWYVSGYMPKDNLKPENLQYHPFGVTFMLRPWNIPNSKLDDDERKPYNRIPMKVIKI